MSETKSFEELFLSQSVEENLKIKHLKILVLNNINSNYLYLFKLKEWQIKSNIYFDYLFYLGNFLSKIVKFFSEELVLFLNMCQKITQKKKKNLLMFFLNLQIW